MEEECSVQKRQGDRLLLHCCCGPCAVYPLRALRQEGFDVTGYFHNPNIHPCREFAARLAAYESLCQRMELPARMEREYGLAPFMTALRDGEPAVYQAKSPERCRLCYRLRLEATAAACLEGGFPAFSTTLLVSPYQRHEVIRELGEEIAAARGLEFVYRDFRPGFRTGQAGARELGLYMQSYCGCVFSEYERYGGSMKSSALERI